MKSLNLISLAVLIAGTTVAACNGTPASDAAATVNGEVIGRADLELEAAAFPAGVGANAAKFQQELLTQVVTRKLLAQEAVAQKIDATPEFKNAERKARETALTEALMRKQVGNKADPTPAAIQSFIAANPAMFRSRELLSLDQLQVEAAAVNNDWLRSASSLADAARILKEHNVAFQWGRATADTVSMAPQLLKVLKDRPDEPFAVPQGDKLVIIQLIDRRPVAVPPEQANAIAATEIRRRAYQQTAAAMLRNLRAKAKITFGDEFAPVSSKK